MADESKPNTEQTDLSRQAIVKALSEMSDELGRRGSKGELCLFGGTVMVLAFAARPSTRDVDAIFQPSEIIREIARNDVSDIIFLIRLLKLRTAADVMDIVAAYYAKNQVPVKAQYLVEGLFEEGKI